MKHVALALLISGLSSAASAQKISEILFNPPSTDAPNEFVELEGTPSSAIAAGTYLVFIEGDLSTAGDVQNIFDLSGLSFGSNGFLVILQNGNSYSTGAGASVETSSATGFSGLGYFSADSGSDIENTSLTALLITAPAAPTLADDIDADDDGTADGAVYASWTILDGVSVLDGAATDPGYAQIVFAEGGLGVMPGGATVVDTGTNTINYVARTAGSTGFAASDWFGGGLSGTAPNFSITAGEAFPASFDNYALDNIGAANGTTNVSDWTTFE